MNSHRLLIAGINATYCIKVCPSELRLDHTNIFQARGIVILALSMFLFWIFATVTYLHNPESDLRDPYCIFILCLGWIGVLFFLCLGPCSKRWRYGIFGKKEEVYKVPEEETTEPEADDTTVSVDESDMTDTMSVTSKGTALEASRWEIHKTPHCATSENALTGRS